MPLNADQLAHLGPELDGTTDEAGFVGINDGPFPNQVEFSRFDSLCSLEQFPTIVENRCHNLHGVILEKAGHTPRDKGAVSKDQDQCHGNNANVSTVWLEAAIIGERSAVQTLRFVRMVEVEVGNSSCDD